MDDLINVVGSDSRLEGGSGDVEDFTSQAADFAHALLLCLVQDRDLVPADKDLLRVGNAIVCVIGAHNVVWQLAAGRERIDGPQGAGVWEGGEWVVLTGGWIWFRDYLGGEEVAEGITCRFVHLLVFTLQGQEVN